jgi:hypothetical protein
MRSPRPVQTVASGIETENGLLFRQTQLAILVTEFRLLIGHQPAQLGHGVSAFGSDLFKCAVCVPRDAKLEPSELRPICSGGDDQLREEEDDCIVVTSRYRLASMSNSAICTKPATRVAKSVVRFVRTIAKCTSARSSPPGCLLTNQCQRRHWIAALD